MGEAKKYLWGSESRRTALVDTLLRLFETCGTAVVVVTATVVDLLSFGCWRLIEPSIDESAFLLLKMETLIVVRVIGKEPRAFDFDTFG